MFDEPSIEDNNICIGKNIGEYSVQIERLLPRVNYYVRAYASNSKGTSYGNTIQITTPAFKTDSVADVDGIVYTTVEIGTQVWFTQDLKNYKII